MGRNFLAVSVLIAAFCCAVSSLDLANVLSNIPKEGLLSNNSKPTFSSYAIFTFRCAGICQASRPEGLRTGSFATDGHRKYMKECSTCDGAGVEVQVLTFCYILSFSKL
jgi:hypothetical protein